MNRRRPQPPPAPPAPTPTTPGETTLAARIPVPQLLTVLDPSYHVAFLNLHGDVQPDWVKIHWFAHAMRHHEFNFTLDRIHIRITPTGPVIHDGNHRVLAAHLAHLPTLDTTIHT